MRDVFGDRRVPISSMKSMLGPLHGRRERARGHRLRLDARDGDLPAHHRLRDARSRVRRRRRGERRAPRARPTSWSTTRSRSAGTTPSPCFARPGVLPPPRRRAPWRREAAGASPASGSSRRSASGARRSRSSRALRARATRRELRRSKDARSVAEVPGFDPAKYLGDKGLRSLDRLTKLLVVAARLALHDARPEERRRVGRRSSPEQVGLVVLERVRLARGDHGARPRREARGRAVHQPVAVPAHRLEQRRAATRASGRSCARSTSACRDGNCGALDAVACADVLLEQGRARRAARRRGRGDERGAVPRVPEARRRGRGRAFGRGDAGRSLGEGAALVALEPTESAKARGATRARRGRRLRHRVRAARARQPRSSPRRRTP